MCIRDRSKDMQICEGQHIQAPICFTCGCKYPFVKGREVNKITWEQPLRESKGQKGAVDRFFALTKDRPILIQFSSNHNEQFILGNFIEKAIIKAKE